ncbi:MAG: Bifunctional enzyme MurC/Ddl, partial [Chlamydiia bacterium]|nr:Bifunctional enzyme MurC/Ddl [Chlamydiia bacterium]
MIQEETYHFIGIGGIGMSGLARILLSRGYTVTGSDAAASAVTQALEKAGAKVYIGHNENYVSKNTTVIFSTDIPATNPELLAAQRYASPLLHRSDLLAKMIQEHKVLAVAGTHGKTTTSSLLTHVLRSAGVDPSFAVGGMLQGHETNAAQGKSDLFVLEADESDGTFLKYDYFAAIVTNIDTDHIVHYGSWDALVEAFSKFIGKAQDQRLLFCCGDDSVLMQLAPSAISYGFSKDVKLHISRFRQKNTHITFDIDFEGHHYADIEVTLTGKHNALNSAAIFGLCISLGVQEEEIRKAFLSFSGVKRRMEKKGDIDSLLIFDDYAHHPTEIKATLKGLREAIHERRIVAVFQPHRYSRMQYTMYELQGAFDEADLLIVTDLYAAGEKAIEGVTTERILEEITKGTTTPIHYIPRTELTSSLHA